MLKKLKLFSKELPLGFKILNLSILLPVLIWPFILFSSIFIFDNPENFALAFLLFLGILAYPLYLLIIAELNARFYFKSKYLSLILPISIIGLIISGIIYIATSMISAIEANKNEEKKRIQYGWLGDCDTYRKKDNKVYYNDTLVNGIDAKTVQYLDCFYIKDAKQVYNGKEVIVGCDPTTFEILDWEWQKDKTQCYYQGKPMPNIDVKSFTLLENNYSKDYKSVYYYDKLVVDADPKTFVVDDFTYLGKDKNNRYRDGEKIRRK